MAPLLQTQLRYAVNHMAKRLNCRPVDIPHENLTQIDYLDMVIKEGLRKNPAIPASLPREVPENGREIAGHFFPAKVRWLYSLTFSNMYLDSCFYAMLHNS